MHARSALTSPLSPILYGCKDVIPKVIRAGKGIHPIVPNCHGLTRKRRSLAKAGLQNLGT